MKTRRTRARLARVWRVRWLRPGFCAEWFASLCLVLGWFIRLFVADLSQQPRFEHERRGGNGGQAKQWQ
jgi:hypothetical protein